jgi:hypothetical protein
LVVADSAEDALDGGFVLEFYFWTRRRGWFGRYRRGRLPDQTGCYVTAQIHECVVGAVKDAMKAGFITGPKGFGAGLVGEPLEGNRHVNADIELGQLLLDFLQLAVHFIVDESDFDGLQTADAPFYADDFFEQEFTRKCEQPMRPA